MNKDKCDKLMKTEKLDKMMIKTLRSKLGLKEEV